MTQDSFVKSSDSDSFKSALEKYDLAFFMSGMILFSFQKCSFYKINVIYIMKFQFY